MRKVLIVVGVVAVLTVVSASAFVFGMRSQSSIPAKSVFEITAGNWTSRGIPVKVCSSSYGIPQTPKKGAQSQAISGLSRSASELALYVDSARTLRPVLGPASWKCSVSEGADGTAILAIYPKGVLNPSGTLNGTEETVGVEAEVIPACQGCIADLVCPVFLNAESQLGYQGILCPSYLPPSESERFIEGNAQSDYGIALLNDPPGEPGTVALSGGDYPALGALIFSGGYGSHDASSIGCVLPQEYRSICREVVKYFVKTHS